MGSIEEPQTVRSGDDKPDYDVLVIGAGLSGIYSVVRLREIGMNFKVLEAGSAEGGTWYWNRYPGARFDSESYSYQYFFSKELMTEWDWSEHFAGQPEILAYINYVCDKFDIRKDIQFDTQVKSAHFDQDRRAWILTDHHGRIYSSRFLMNAIGILTNPTLPNIPGVETFKGEAHHTARWPKSPVSFEHKRVAVLGTGATGIQTIQEVAKTAGHLTVLQRRANWACPMHNAKIDSEEMKRLREWYPQMMDQCANAYQAFLHPAESKKSTDVSLEEREAFWEDLYNSRGFGIWFSNFSDVGLDRKANKECSDFIAKKIRQRVNDPKTAEALIPKDHGFATRRVPLETHYYEVYNQPNVRLVNLRETPIACVTEKGVKTSTEDLEFDMIIYATGFDAVTGSFDAIDFRGVNGTRLRDVWKGGPKTYLGMTVQHFPNMFTVLGPHQAFGNNPRSIEYTVYWITDLLKYCRDHDITYVEATTKGVTDWTKHVLDLAEGSLGGEIDSWMTGVNSNVAGKQTRMTVTYGGSVQLFRQQCDEVKHNNYETFRLE